ARRTGPARSAARPAPAAPSADPRRRPPGPRPPRGPSRAVRPGTARTPRGAAGCSRHRGRSAPAPAPPGAPVRRGPPCPPRPSCSLTAPRAPVRSRAAPTPPPGPGRYGGDDQVGPVAAPVGKERRGAGDERENRVTRPAEDGRGELVLGDGAARHDPVDDRIRSAAQHLDPVAAPQVPQRGELAQCARLVVHVPG